MRQQTVTVTIPGGIHARIAAELAAVVAAHTSSVFLMAGRMTSLARSWEVLSLGVSHGEQVTVIADGRDEEQALAAVVALLGH